MFPEKYGKVKKVDGLSLNLVRANPKGAYKISAPLPRVYFVQPYHRLHILQHRGRKRRISYYHYISKRELV